MHVKLSDYGISRFATPQGMLGEEGTPGFQAPEVRAGSTYNEKVRDVVLTLYARFVIIKPEQALRMRTNSIQTISDV